MNKSQETRIQSGAAGEVGRWCVVESNSRQEKLAKFHLERRGFRVYLPMRAVPKKKPNLDTAAPLFPSYVFVQVDTETCAWADVFSAIGVRSVLGAGGKPKVARIGLIEAIREREVYGLVQMKAAPAVIPHKAGDRVKVTSGPFAEFDAIFQEAVDAKRVMILLSLFDRRTRVMVSADQLRKAS